MRDPAHGSHAPLHLDRRAFLQLLAGGLILGRPPARLLGATDPLSTPSPSAALRPPRPLPTLSQLQWQRDERAIFVHFGINTFTGREWGDGTEDPALFDPSALDARQWARSAREAGFRAMVLTAKHHDGFCLWPTSTTAHSVASSPWRAGEGDVVREFVDACRAEGLRPGLYCSPWDRNASVYGTPGYNDFYAQQLTELLTHYGPIHEVWFDGANGEGPSGRRQEYDWPRIWGLVRRLQPDAVIFSDAGPDVRWIGNEAGVAGDPNWSTVDPDVVPVPGVSGEAVIQQLQHGDPQGSVWRPGEADVSIRPGWFYHPEEDDRVRSADDLVELFFTSVGRNSKLLLNVPPTPEGLLHATDVARLHAMDARLHDLFADDVADGGTLIRRPTGTRSAVQELTLPTPAEVAVADLQEDITRGQSVASWALEGEVQESWQPLARGTTIGYRRLTRFPPATVRRVRLTLRDQWGPPPVVSIALHAG